MQPDTTIPLPEPWAWTDEDLTAELYKEAGPSHQLYGKKARTIARRYDRDDVLYVLEGGAYAFVHLTWSHERENSSYWPSSVIYKDWEEVFVNRILPDSADWEE